MSDEPAILPPPDDNGFDFGQQFWRTLFSWQTWSRLGGYATLAVELRQVLVGQPVDTGLVVLAGGLLGVASAFKRNGGAS